MTAILTRCGLAFLAFLLLMPAVALADCGDKPKPGVNWSRCTKDKLILKGKDLSGGRFENTDFTAANLIKVKLTGANLVRANLTRTAFDGADLEGANLSKAFGSRTRFQGANLARADLQGATLKDVDLRGAYLYLTQIQDVDLSQNVQLTAEQLEIACGDAGTKLPDGMTAPAAWPCPEED